MSANDPAAFQPSTAAISKLVYSAVGERYYKVGRGGPALCACAGRALAGALVSGNEQAG